MHTRLSVAAAKRWMALGKLQFIISCFLVCLPLLLLIAIAINFVILESFPGKYLGIKQSSNGRSFL